MKFSNTFSVAIVSTTALMISACGPIQSSPKNYRQLQNQGVPTTKTSYTPEPPVQPTVKKEDQPILSVGSLIDLQTNGSLNFVEGEPSGFLVEAKVKQFTNLNFELVFSGLPDGAIVQKIDKNTSKVSWTPKPGFIEADKDSKSVKFQVELKQASKLSVAEQKLFDAQTKKESFELLVSRTKENPVVQKVTGLEGVISEGAEVKFTVEVRDPGAQSDVAPEVTIKKDNDSTQETVGVDGADYITVDPAQAKPTSSSPGIWQFHYIYDTKSKAAPRPSKLGAGNKQLAADEIPVRFKVQIVSPSHRSTSTTEEFRLKYNTQGQAPAFEVAQGDSLSVDIGQTLQVDIKASSPIENGRVVVNANDIQAELNKTLPGGSKANIFRCKNNSSAAVECRLAWKVPCDDALVGSTQKISLKASNFVGAIGVEAEFDRAITVTKTKECTAANHTAGGKK